MSSLKPLNTHLAVFFIKLSPKPVAGAKVYPSSGRATDIHSSLIIQHELSNESLRSMTITELSEHTVGQNSTDGATVVEGGDG